MYINDIVKKLDQSIMRIGNTDYYPADKVRHELDELSTECIQWSIEDFEHMAIQCKGNDWEEYYDKNMFGDALECMIYDHNAEYGISWDTVQEYLQRICARRTTEAMKRDTYNGTK